jgi:hypothetical protein
MTNDLDGRIADLAARRREKGVEIARDTVRMEEVVAKLAEAVHQASASLDGLNVRTDLIDQSAAKLERRVRRFGLAVVAGIVTTFGLAALILAVALWSGAKIEAAAENESKRLQDVSAFAIAMARQEGEAELADLTHQSEDAAQQFTEIAADLARVSQERDTVRSELEYFVQLQERVGIQLLNFRGRTVVVVPEEARLRRWRAPELSEFTQLNGRMYRLSD